MRTEKRENLSSTPERLDDAFLFMDEQQLAESLERFMAYRQELAETLFSKSAIVKGLEQSHQPKH